MSSIKIVIFISGIILVTYGYFCRILNIYFFWESKYIGWVLIVIGIISFLITRVKLKRIQNKKSLWEKIGIGLFTFFLLIQGGLYFIIPTTEAYNVSIEYLESNQILIDDIGIIKEISIVPLGIIESTTANEETSGNATIYLIVKGEKKYKDVKIQVKKTPHTEWTVLSIK